MCNVDVPPRVPPPRSHYQRVEKHRHRYSRIIHAEGSALIRATSGSSSDETRNRLPRWLKLLQSRRAPNRGAVTPGHENHMIGFHIVNLLPPTLDEFVIRTAAGPWEFEPEPTLLEHLAQIERGASSNTYAMHSMAGTDRAEAALGEVAPLLLACSYLRGGAVTSLRTMPWSEIALLSPSEHWPRDRSVGQRFPLAQDLPAFIASVECFVASWQAASPADQARWRLLVHLLQDVYSAWSLESATLALCAGIEAIAHRESAQPSVTQTLTGRLGAAASRLALAPLHRDAVRMRNTLFHQGTIGPVGQHRTKEQCAVVITDMYRFVDQYLFAEFGLGAYPADRRRTPVFAATNSFSNPNV